MAIKKTLTIFDEDSGEILLEKTSSFKNSDNGKDWCIMYQLTLYLLATDKSFTFSDVRVYMFICANVDWKCMYFTTKSDLAKSIGMSYPQLLASIKTLKDKDLIREGKANGNTFFAINPERVSRGKNRGQLRRAYNKIPQNVVKKISFEEKVAEIASSF